MPCLSDEEEVQIPEQPNQVTPTKPPRNDGAGSTIRMPKFRSFNPTRKRRSVRNRRGSAATKFKRVIAEYELVRRWVTAERAVQPEEEIERELFEEARELMHLPGLKKLPCHKGLDTDLHLHCFCFARSKPQHERECRTPLIAVICGICESARRLSASGEGAGF
jgi:hypothetical protein